MSVRLKRAAAKLFAPVGAFRAYGTLNKAADRQLLLLGYHRILPLTDDVGHAGDAELISATPEEFAWQVRYVCKRFEPVTFTQIADHFEGLGSLPPRAVAITFDDGFDDVFDYALPVLERAGAPATVFISTGYVDSRQPFWFDLVAWIALNAPQGTELVQTGDTQIMADGIGEERRATAYRVLKWMKSCSEQEREAALGSILEQFADLAASGAIRLGKALTWPQVAELSRRGIEIGSHTVSHPCLARLDQKTLERELQHSKSDLEAHTRMRVSALAYPFGGAQAFDRNVIATAKRVGYRVATTYIPGVNELERAEPFTLLRQHVERNTSRSEFEALVHMPAVFH